MSIVFNKSKEISLDDETLRSDLLKIASGMDNVIALGRGDPDFHTPRHIVEAAKKALDENKHHYTPPTGLPELRKSISKNFELKYNLDYSDDEIIITAGVQESIALAMISLLKADDEVLITSPRFTTYDLTVRMCNAKPVPVHTYEKDNFALMPELIEQKITKKTKLLVLVSPNNPTGAVTPPNNIKKIAQIAIDNNLIVISDEIYADLIYDSHEHLSIGSLEKMKERTLTLNGFSKTYAMTGWRVGYIAGPKDIINKMKNEYNERRKFSMKALSDIGFTYGDPGGAFYIYTNVSNSNMTASNFCRELLVNTGVLMFPGILFGDEDDKYIRLSYLQPIEKIEESMTRINNFLK